MTDSFSKEPRATRGNWGLAVEIEPHFWRLRLKNAHGSLMINTYIYHDDNVFAVFDPGWPWALDQLERAFQETDMGSINDVTHWVYTHSHIDHMGAAALIGQRSNARHFVAEKLEPHFATWHQFVDNSNNWLPWAMEAVAEPDVLDLFRASRQRKLDLGRTMLQMFGAGQLVNYQTIRPGEDLKIGPLVFDILDIKGHDPAHLGFYEKNKKWLITGDVILSTPTPLSVSMNDNIDDYYISLQFLRQLDVSILLPGHGVHKKKNFLRSVDRSLGHLEQYRSFALSTLSNAIKPLTLMDICLRFDPTLLDRDPTYSSVQIALFDSHLRKLIGEGLVGIQSGPTYHLL